MATEKPKLTVSSTVHEKAIDWNKLDKDKAGVQREVKRAVHAATIGVLRSRGLLKEPDAKVFEAKSLTIKPPTKPA
jgi:hypothetical protein